MELSLSEHQPELCQAHSRLPGCNRTNGHHEVSGTKCIYHTNTISKSFGGFGSILGLGPVIIFKLWLITLHLMYSSSKLSPFFRQINHLIHCTTYLELFQKLAETFSSRLKDATPQRSLTLLTRYILFLCFILLK